jgi:hypothetical protein
VTARVDAIRTGTGAGMAGRTGVLIGTVRASMVATGIGTATMAAVEIGTTGATQIASGIGFVRGRTTAMGRAALIVTTTSEDVVVLLRTPASSGHSENVGSYDVHSGSTALLNWPIQILGPFVSETVSTVGVSHQLTAGL